MEVAALGLRVDGVTDIDSASSSLDKFQKSAARAENSADSFGQGTGKAFAAASKSLTGFEALAARAAKESQYLAQQVQKLSDVDIRNNDIQAYGAELDRLRAKYNPLFAASKAYETELDELNRAHRVGAINAQEHANALNTLNARFAQSGAAANTAKVNYQALGGGMGGLAAQFQDIGVTAAMGMNPLIIGLQQGTQIAGQMEAAMSRGASAVGVFSTAFKSLLGPVTAASIGLTVLASALIQAVDWAKLGKTALNALADAIEVIAPYAAVAAAGLAVLYAPTILGGIISLTTALLSVGKAALTAAAAFALANPATVLVIGFAAAVTAAYVFRDAIKKAVGVDVIGVIKDAANYVINSFVAAYEDIKFVWNNFGNVMGAAVIGGVNIAITAINKLIQKAVEGINGLIGLIREIPGLGDTPLVGQALGISEIANPYAKMLEGSVAERNKKLAEIMGRDSVGAFVKGASEAGDKAADWLRKLTFGDGKGNAKAMKEAARAAQENQQVIDGLAESLLLASLRGEELAVAQAKLSLNEYATPEQISRVESLAKAVYQAQEAMRQRQKFGDTANEADKYILGNVSPLSGGAFDDQFARYEAEAEAEQKRYDEQLERLRMARELQIETQLSYNELEEQAARQHAARMAQIDEAKAHVMLSMASDAFGQLASIMRQSQGEQSGIYRAMFAVSKAFAIADTTINAYNAISKAWASAPFPANLLAVAATAPQVMAVVSAVAGTGLSGMAHDGIDSVPETGTWLLQKGERVTTANTSAKLDSVLERIDARQRGARASQQEAANQNFRKSSPTVNLIEDRSRAGTVQTREGVDREEIIDIFVADIRGGGRSADAIEMTYPVRRMGR